VILYRASPTDGISSLRKRTTDESIQAQALVLSLHDFPLAIIYCCDAPIEQYESRSPAEKEIISLLVHFQNARNRFDLQCLLPLLHDKGEFTFQCGIMVSKNRLEEMLPSFWAELKWGNTAVIPLVHECINGDYYTTGTLHNPQITIHNDETRTTVLFAKGVCRVTLYVNMRREEDRWRIIRTA
jgi:hypothetical protein